MIIIISPAKTMNCSSRSPNISTTPIFVKEVNTIINICKNLKHQEIKQLMSLSSNLADLNYDRFQQFLNVNTHEKQAIFTYNGDVYNKIKAQSFTKEDIKFAQNSIKIISGLYGILRPLDLIRPYRLEMGTKLVNNLGQNLYFFWREKITNYLTKELKKHNNKTLLNLASKEYSSVIDRNNFSGKIIEIIFKEKKNGITKIIPINSKRVRGIMVNYIIKEKIDNHELLKDFQEDGYKFDKNMSSDREIFFIKSL